LLLKKLSNRIKDEEYTLSQLPEFFIKNLLDKQDNIPEASRAGTYSGYVHVSSLSGNFCAREYAIAQHEKLQLFETIQGGSKVTFKIGRAVETHVRDNIISGHGKKNIFCKWTCNCGKTAQIGLWREAVCPKCQSPLDNFDEPTITDEANGVSGRPDLIVYYGKTLHITEIKSIKKDTTTTVGWDELEVPLESHIKQNIFYPPLLQSLGYPVSPIVTFIYCSKDWKFGSPYKEFRIDTSLKQYKDKREELLAEAKQVKDFVAGGESPPRICLSEQSPLAKKCPVAFRCFNVYKDDIK
jgi:hypothetical protein